ncbi:MAG: hypothetical protein LBT78_12535 [Tannerella sp.]|jgi:hypothetical protein|nr:hypothetical protein [Tannerella sp.]
MPDYIPRKDAEVVAWSANFATQVADNGSAWSISEQEVSDLQTAVTAFAALYAQANSPAKSPIIVAEKCAARTVLVGHIRALVNFRLKNPVITDAQRIATGIPVHDTVRSTIPVPVSRPNIDIDVLDVRRLKVHFQNMGSAGKAKPRGVNGAIIVYAVLDLPPSSPAALTRSVLATRTPHTLEFTEQERGRTVYVAICWQNGKGERGPLSEIESAVVP